MDDFRVAGFTVAEMIEYRRVLDTRSLKTPHELELYLRRLEATLKLER